MPLNKKDEIKLQALELLKLIEKWEDAQIAAEVIVGEYDLGTTAQNIWRRVNT